MSSIRDVWQYANSIIRSARQIINQELRPLGLSSAEGNILLHMWVKNEKMCQDQLVQQLDISKAAISRAVDSLEEKGYLIRQKDPGDKRFYQLMLSGNAKQIGPRIEQVYSLVYAQAMKNISPDEFDYLIELLRRISKNFTDEQ